MAKVNVKERKQENEGDGRKAWGGGGGGPSIFASKPQTVVLRPVKFTHFKSGTGNPVCSILFIILKGLKGCEPGKVIERNFYLTEKALPFFADFAIAMGYEADEFDPESARDVENILKSGTRSVVSFLKEKENAQTGKKYIEATSFAGQDDDTPNELRVKDFDEVKKLSIDVNWKEAVQAYEDFREKNPRKINKKTSDNESHDDNDIPF